MSDEKSMMERIEKEERQGGNLDSMSARSDGK